MEFKSQLQPENLPRQKKMRRRKESR